jgi:predicted HTH transcriptional regulator
MVKSREYTNAHTATFIIYKDRVEIKNANNPRDFRRLEIGSFEPFQKNPNIARFYRALGRSEEIGSGIRNVNKYLSVYANGALPYYGVHAADIGEHLSVSVKTVERYISILRKLEIISHSGSRRTGGYYITENFKNKI